MLITSAGDFISFCLVDQDFHRALLCQGSGQHRHWVDVGSALQRFIAETWRPYVSIDLLQMTMTLTEALLLVLLALL